MSRSTGNLWVVVLAGGDGRRMSAYTTDKSGVSIPKQYCSLDGGQSLLQLALNRACGLVPRERIVTVVTEPHRRWWESELMAMRRSPVVVQPSNRGTGLGVLLPLLTIAKSDPSATVLCMPSDHFVEQEDLLAEFLRQATALELRHSRKLTLLGMAPNAPDSGFGYLVPSPESRVGMRPVRQFVEKPDTPTAEELIRTGSAWSTGIFAGRLAEIVRLYPRQVPSLMPDLKSIVEYWQDPRTPSAELKAFYSRHATVDFSHDVLEQHPDELQFLMVPSCGWNDVGTPERLAAAVWTLRAKRSCAVTSPISRTFSLATHLEALVDRAFEDMNLSALQQRIRCK